MRLILWESEEKGVGGVRIWTQKCLKYPHRLKVHLHTAGVTGSIPVPPTNTKPVQHKAVPGTRTLLVGMVMLPRQAGKDMLS